MKLRCIISTVLLLALGSWLVFSSCAPREHRNYTCPMHPQIIQDHPGSCPICGMTLVPVEPEQSPTPMPGAGVEGRTMVRIDSRKQQLIGVKTDAVMKRELGRSVSTVGVVAYDPELYYAQEQYLNGLKSMKEAQASGRADTARAARESMESAKARLKALGLSEERIAAFAGMSGPDKSLLASGSGRAWVYAQVYQEDLSGIKRGQSVEITSATTGGKKISGSVTAIDPSLDPATRSARVRIQAENTGGVLKPEMYVDVRIKSPVGSFLSIPAEAVLDTGTRQIAFVDKGDGYFEPRSVVLGEKMEDYYIVKAGVKDGESVVVNANFLIDSESQLKAALKGF
ncbi:MAG: efflux RND transporter periplasmic adaptor subunit [Spirochaetia bacterium]|nr:efflux RND transporter periplasmic adaptor subunit [Spirochaetia bacterium]